ncbi:DNA invertase Pin-like site-specific DNA recombinase [Nitrospirillum amazonense]|uniref:DNA invertase Pin-like site-specific DNA recombinase n=1 Tax=Nitrospirillum amazonense TaxID=28077 RepID=A0A560FLV5_9PROT|nr:recombinase family protein [Nitrospirillum amazonense]TWB22598.1 DNA invertase Pin-like site-specific DNA recombinase [Nitrospirillum amazonense]
MFIGYARTSTLDQTAGLDAQRRDLLAAGVEEARLYVEQVSSVDIANRTELAAALDYIRDGDVLVVTKLDRLARSVAHLMEIVQVIEGKGAALRILDLGVDTSTPTGKLMLTMLGGVAEFERSIMLERQREGIAKAKAAGKYQGRKPTAKNQADDVVRMWGERRGATEIAKALEMSRRSVYRILGEAGVDVKAER